jgi:hypothetical protein
VPSIRPGHISCTHFLLKNSAGQHRRTLCAVRHRGSTGLQPARGLPRRSPHRRITRGTARTRPWAPHSPGSYDDGLRHEDISNQTMTQGLNATIADSHGGSRRANPGACAPGSRKSERPLNVIAARPFVADRNSPQKARLARWDRAFQRRGLRPVAIMRHTANHKRLLALARRPQLRPKAIPMDGRP